MVSCIPMKAMNRNLRLFPILHLITMTNNHDDAMKKAIFMISTTLADNKKRIEQEFASCDDLNVMTWRFGNKRQYEGLSVFFQSLSKLQNQNFMHDTLQSVVDHIVGSETEIEPKQLITFFEQHGAGEHHTELIQDWEQFQTELLKGSVIIFIDGWDKALRYEADNHESRAVSEPVSEPVVRGPREGTVEDLRKNLGLLRSRLRSPNFKIVKIKTGGKSNTEAVYGYLEGTVPKKTLALFQERIAKAANYEVLETSYLEEIIEDAPYSPFPQNRYTERPDTAIAAVLEGKIIVLVNGTGSILICPGLFTEFFQSSEDYYERTVISSFIRLLRIIAFFIALTLPSIYISLSTFHPEMIPTVLLLAILDTREGIPFPAFVEAVIMLFFFELLREAGIRLPRPVGSAVSIVGALIIGEASINAGIASPIMVVIVSLTGIASFSIPQYTIAISLRLLQLPLMILTATLGMFGALIGMLWIVLHLSSLKSLGQPYMSPLAPMRPSQLADTLVRAPLRRIKRSPRVLHNKKHWK